MSSMLDYLSDEDTTSCSDEFDLKQFYLYLLIPATILTLVMAATKRRRNILLSVLSGRPGLIYPMDILIRTSRISYACAFGSIAYHLLRLVLGDPLVVTDDHRAVRALLRIVSVLIYGIDFFPLFACLALRSALCLGLGSAYVWMLLSIHIYQLTQCDVSTRSRVASVMESLPNILCLLYLSGSIPVRFVQACRQRHFLDDVEENCHTDTILSIKESPQGQHVTKLFRKERENKCTTSDDGTQGRFERIRALIRKKIGSWIYHNNPGFRYPARPMSVMFVSCILIYMLTVQSFLIISRSSGNGKLELSAKVSLIIACVIVAVLSYVTILHTASSFRKNLLSVYKGNYRHIGKPTGKNNPSLLVGAFHFAGFQVAYIIFSYLINFLVIGIVLFLFGLIVSRWWDELTDYAIDFLIQILTWIPLFIILMVGQRLLAKYVFLTDNGKLFQLDNRRFFFVVAYFMFFYNIIIGLFSCFKRILFGIVIASLYLGRLDYSIMPRKFESLDPGFRAYRGFIHLEATHTHPVMLVFIRLLAMMRRKKERPSEATDNVYVEINLHGHNGSLGRTSQDHRNSTASDSSRLMTTRQRAARFHWHIAYSLLRNPSLCAYRRSYILEQQLTAIQATTSYGHDTPKTTNGPTGAMSVQDSQKESGLSSLASKVKDTAKNIRMPWKRQQGPNDWSVLSDEYSDTATVRSQMENFQGLESSPPQRV